MSLCPVYEHMYQSPLAAHLPAVLPQLLQTIADKDRPLAKHAKGCTEFVANTPMLAPSVLPRVLSTAQEMVASPSWHVRAAVLPFLQTTMFRHQFVVRREDMDKVTRLVVELLRDSQVEVREMASASVAVLVRINGDELALSLQVRNAKKKGTTSAIASSEKHAQKAQSLQALQANVHRACQQTRALAHQLSHQLYGSRAPADWGWMLAQDKFREWAMVPIPRRITAGEGAAALQQRHAGVLGLAALVGSHPYDVPPWMPAILVKLASHIGEPMPIKQTVKNTFGEVRSHVTSLEPYHLTL